MEFGAIRRMIHGLAPVLVLPLLGSLAAAENPKSSDYLKNIELCNGYRSHVVRRPDRWLHGADRFRPGHDDVARHRLQQPRQCPYRQGDYDRAIPDFDRSIKLDPANAKPLNNRGAAYLRKGEYDLAIQSFDEAIKLKPNYGGAFANRAGAYLKKNEYDRAARDYDEAVRLEPNRASVWAGRCWTRAVLGSLQEALDDCRRALQQSPDDAAAHDSLGLIHLKMGQFGTAIDDFSSALRFDPKLASALYGRGLAKLGKGDVAGSKADMTAAKTIRAEIGDDFTRYGVKGEQLVTRLRFASARRARMRQRTAGAAPCQRQSSFTFASVTTLRQRSISADTIFANAAPVTSGTSEPLRSQASLMAGVCMAFCNSLVICWTMCRRRVLGANRPYQVETS